MTGPTRVIDGAVIKAAIERRAPGRADRQLLADVLAAVAVTPQVRRPILPAGIRGRRETWLLLAAATLTLALLFMLGGGSDQPSLVPNPSGSASPPLSPSSVPTVQVTEPPCATATSTIASGSAMPDTTIQPAVVSEGAIEQGVYVTQAEDSRTASVWSVTAGPASRIATVSGPDFNRAAITDVSRDGRLALLQVGEFHGGLPRPVCDDLYLVRTDGSGVERLTFNGGEQHATDGRLSSDARYIAYQAMSDLDRVQTLVVLDLEGDGVPHETDCSGTSQTIAYAWAPTDDRLVAQCNDRVELLSGGSISARTAAPPLAGGLTTMLGWRDAGTILLIVEDDGATINGPMRLFSADTAALATGAASDRWREPLTITPLLYDAVAAGPLPDPSGAAVALFATESESQAYAWYVVDVATGGARQVTGEFSGAVGWSADGGSLVLVHYASAPDSIELVTVDVASGARRTVGTLPPEYWNGIWHGG